MALMTIGDIFRAATNYKMERGDEKLIDEYTLYGIYNAEADGFLYTPHKCFAGCACRGWCVRYDW